ncbi:hypothetical protein BHM03_00007131 [Ensete ventricosum]|nr:hypothetical protein BHM03_00007131 [Ensete ventricosum]
MQPKSGKFSTYLVGSILAVKDRREKRRPNMSFWSWLASRMYSMLALFPLSPVAVPGGAAGDGLMSTAEEPLKNCIALRSPLPGSESPVVSSDKQMVDRDRLGQYKRIELGSDQGFRFASEIQFRSVCRINHIANTISIR